MIKNCEYPDCQQPFEMARVHQKYCSPQCRNYDIQDRRTRAVHGLPDHYNYDLAPHLAYFLASRDGNFPQAKKWAKEHQTA